jgi:amino acid adenylation domain-containing protein
LKELSEFYNAYLENRKPNLPILPIQFKDYAEWEQSSENRQKFEKQEKYWLQKLSGELPILNLPTDKIRPSVLTYNGQNEVLKLDSKISQEIIEYCRQTGNTLFTFIMSVFLVFLNKLTSQEDIIVGMPTANRDHPELENIIGVLVNSLAIRNKIDSDQRFNYFLKQIKLNIIESMENKDCSIDKLIEKLNPERDTSRAPLFSVVCQMYDQLERGRLELKNIKIKSKEINIDTTTADLRFYTIEKKEQIIFNLDYNTDLFYSSTIKRWMGYIVNLTQDIIAHPEKKIGELELISKKEKEQLIHSSNQKQKNYPFNKTIHQLFEEQVQKTPDNIAIISADRKLTYREINQQANQLAHYFLKQKIKREEIIPIILDNSSELVVGMLAVLKAGGAFVLIDKNTPTIRIDKIIKDTKAKMILSESNFLEKQKEFSNQKNTNPKLNIRPENLSNILYTSSTTGESKGVMLEHRNIVKYVCQLRDNLQIKPNDHLSQSSSVSYAITLWHIFTPLSSGAHLHLYSSEISQNPFKLLSLARKDKIRLLETTPSFLNIFLDSADQREISDLIFKELILTGENIPEKLIQKLNHINPKLKIFSHYGQAEIQTPTQLYKIKKDNRIFIGKPENGSQIYILDNHLNPVPFGLPGIIYASGEDLLFRGYLNDSKKTREVISSHPFISGRKIYCTGDIGKMHPDGNIEYLGRADQQVKIRGNRVEPGEIEDCLNRHPKIKRSVVLSRKEQESGDYYLVAYYTVSAKTSTEELRDYLKNILPAFMIPSYFIETDKFSLNQNGKLDYAALPEPDREAQLKKYQSPRTELEKKLTEIWQEVLHIKKIGINDNFFELGGHSLKAVQLVVKMKKYELGISLSEIFKHPTIFDLSNHIEKSKNVFKEASIIGGVPLTAIYDWFSVNRKNYFEKNKAHFEIRILDSDILARTYLQLSRLYMDVHFYALLVNEKKNKWKEIKSFSKADLKQVLVSDLKEIKIKKSDKKFEKSSIFFKSSFVGGIYHIFFQTKSVDFDKSKFAKILKDFQKIYNLLLLGSSQKEIAKYFYGKKENRVPIYGYPEYYDCAYATISEIIRQKNDKKIFKSLIPGFNLESLPSYCIIGDLIRKNSNISVEHLRRKKFFDILGIKYSVKILKNSEEAMRFYKKQTRKNNPIILVGTAYYLPFAEKSYRSSQFIRSCIKGKRVPSNWSIFYGMSGNYSIIYSPNIGFFGKIPQKEFIQFWRGTESIPELSEVQLDEKITAYQVIDIEDVPLIKEHSVDMLREALKINILEFYNSKTIESKKDGKPQKVFFGKKAILMFKKDIEDSIKNRKKSIPDIFIIDMLKKMEMAHLFLRDMILDISLENRSFIKELKICKDMIEIWEGLFKDAECLLKTKNINYRYNIYLPPDSSLWNVGLFSKQEKKKIVQSIVKISNMENKLFYSLKIKLKIDERLEVEKLDSVR